jgi:hypothetical protein
VLLRPEVVALWPSAIVAVALVVDAVRLARPRLALLAAPVMVRLVAILVVLAGGGVLTVAGALLVCAVAGGLLGALGPVRWRAAGMTTTIVAAPLVWLLLGDHALMRAVTITVAGLVLAGIGVVRRRSMIAHAGGALAVLGTWQLLAVLDVTAVDLWMLPVAAQLWLAGIAARRSPDRVPGQRLRTRREHPKCWRSSYLEGARSGRSGPPDPATDAT